MAALVGHGAAVILNLVDGRLRRLDGDFSGACWIASDRVAFADMIPFKTIVVSRDGERIADFDGIVRARSADGTRLAIEPRPIRADNEIGSNTTLWKKTIDIRDRLDGGLLERIDLGSWESQEGWNIYPQVCITSDNNKVIVGRGGDVIVWDLMSGKTLQTIIPGGSGPGYIAGVALSSDDQHLVIGSANLGTLCYERLP